MKVIVYDKETGEKSPEIEMRSVQFVATPDNNHWLMNANSFPERYELRPVLEGVEVVFSKKLNGVLGMFSETPILKQHSIQPIKPHGYYIEMAAKLFPFIKPGQCIKAKIVLEEE